VCAPQEKERGDPGARFLRTGSPRSLVALLKATAHPCNRVRRLLEIAQSWPESLPDEVPASVKYRTLKQLRSSEVSPLVDGYQSGATVYELAKQFGIHRATVGVYLRARGIDTTPPAIRPEDVSTVVDLYQTGRSLRRIGEKFGVSDAAVRARLLQAGVRIRGTHERVN